MEQMDGFFGENGEPVEEEEFKGDVVYPSDDNEIEDDKSLGDLLQEIEGEIDNIDRTRDEH